MQRRKLGRLKEKVSPLGFGAMRLPHLEGDTSKIQEKEAQEMIHYAIHQGVNYLDTAWPYHQEESEPFLGKILGDGYREKVILATKMPTWLIEKRDHMDDYLKKQLQRLKTETIDVYLLHALNREKWEKLNQLGVLTWLEKKRKEGFIREFGFSFHDSLPIFQEIMDSYPWPICQIQYNYVDREYQAGEKGLQYAAQKGTDVIIMEPLRGGTLAELPPKLQNTLNRGERKKTAVDWALQWLWNQEEVPLVLSGMSTKRQVEENIESAKEAEPHSLSREELENIDSVTRLYKELAPTNCTGCNYCIPCPENISIHHMMALYNEAHIYKNTQEKKKSYQSFPEKMRSSNCTGCNTCVDKCPQNLPIPELMKKITQYFNGE